MNLFRPGENFICSFSIPGDLTECSVGSVGVSRRPLLFSLSKSKPASAHNTSEMLVRKCLLWTVLGQSSEYYSEGALVVSFCRRTFSAVW